MARAPIQILVILFRRSASGEFEFAVMRRTNTQGWGFVAGGAEGDETPEQAACREAMEETGIACAELIRLDSFATIPRHAFGKVPHAHWPADVLVVPEYTFGAQAQGDIVLSAEHCEFRWLPFREASAIVRWDSNRNALWELNERLTRSNIHSN